MSAVCECEGCECKGCVSEAVATDKEDTEVAEQGTSHHRMTSKKNVKAYFIRTYVVKISCKTDQLVLIII